VCDISNGIITYYPKAVRHNLKARHTYYSCNTEHKTILNFKFDYGRILKYWVKNTNYETLVM
jgi:hypothetical protein